MLSVWGRVHRACWLMCLVGVALALGGCRREIPSGFDRNLAPETYLTGVPAESSIAFYQSHLHWLGVDPDGSVEYYEFAITDTNILPEDVIPGFSGFYRTTATDSVFRLTANDPQFLGHRFYIRAVDNEGKVDPTPAWTYFVAFDFNLPNVIFTRAMGTWVDSRGQDHSIDITSGSTNDQRFNPTDTIGVGGCIDVAWTGVDADRGGEVIAFEYRARGQGQFQGGTLADTAYSSCYSPTFSGNEVVYVHAIDDAGAATLPDSARSVVVNFSPTAWIVDPDSPTPVRRQVFRTSNGVVHPSGTTLADGARSISFAYTGFDDARDYTDDPSDPNVVGFSYRRLQSGGGLPYRDIPVDLWAPYPATNIFQAQESQFLQSGDYTFLLRAQDGLGRWGVPDTVRVSVNYPAYFVSVNYVDASGTERPLWDPFADPGDPVLAITLPANGGNPAPLQVKILALDTHSADDPHPLELRPVVEDEDGSVAEYRATVNGSAGGFEPAPPGEAAEVFFPVATDPGASQAVRPGQNTMQVQARDESDRVTTLIFSFSASFIE